MNIRARWIEASCVVQHQLGIRQKVTKIGVLIFSYLHSHRAEVHWLLDNVWVLWKLADIHRGAEDSMKASCQTVLKQLVTYFLHEFSDLPFVLRNDVSLVLL